MPSATVLSVFNLRPRRIGGMEVFARELSHQLDDRAWKSVLCFSEDPSAGVREFVSQANVRWETIDGLSHWNRESVFSLSRLLARYRPSVLHLHFTSFFGPYVWLAKLHGVRSVFSTDHMSRPAGYDATPTACWKKAVLRATVPITRIICVSKYVAQCRVDSQQYPGTRNATICNGVDVGRCQSGIKHAAEFRARYDFPSESVIVTQIASMIPGKGYVDLLRAARCVLEVAPTTRFVMAGDGHCQPEYMSLARELGMEKHVVFTGLVHDPVNEGLFAGSDIVCQASQWNEAFGFTIAEAMATAKPIVATRVGVIPELVEHGRTGYLVERGCVEELADRILTLVKDAGLRDSLGRRGLALCIQKFDHYANARQLIEHYQLNEERPGKSVAVD